MTRRCAPPTRSETRYARRFAPRFARIKTNIDNIHKQLSTGHANILSISLSALRLENKCKGFICNYLSYSNYIMRGSLSLVFFNRSALRLMERMPLASAIRLNDNGLPSFLDFIHLHLWPICCQSMTWNVLWADWWQFVNQQESKFRNNIHLTSESESDSSSYVVTVT